MGESGWGDAIANLVEYPYLWRVLLNSAVIALVAAWLGVQVLSRGIVFLGLAVAQGAVAGMTLAFWLRFHSLLGSLLFVLGTVAALGTGRPRSRGGGEESKVAILYVTFLALGALFLVVNPRGEGRMLRIFYGNVITINTLESWVLWGVAALLIGIQAYRWKGFLWLCADPLTAPAFGLSYLRYNLLFYLLLGAGLVMLLHFAGLVVPLALMVAPAFTAFHTVTGMKRVMAVALGLAVVPMLLGVMTGLALTPDYPLGTMITVFVLGSCLLFYGVAKGAAMTAARAAARSNA